MNKYITEEIRKLDLEIGKRLFSISKGNHISTLPSPLQARIAEYLMRNQNKVVYQKDLEDVCIISKAAISSTLQSMESNNYIKRVVSKNDARAKRIIITENLKKIYEEHLKIFKTLNKELSKNITEEELDTFIKIIKKMTNNLKEHKYTM